MLLIFLNIKFLKNWSEFANILTKQFENILVGNDHKNMVNSIK